LTEINENEKIIISLLQEIAEDDKHWLYLVGK